MRRYRSHDTSDFWSQSRKSYSLHAHVVHAHVHVHGHVRRYKTEVTGTGHGSTTRTQTSRADLERRPPEAHTHNILYTLCSTFDALYAHAVIHPFHSVFRVGAWPPRTKSGLWSREQLP